MTDEVTTDGPVILGGQDGGEITPEQMAALMGPPEQEADPSELDIACGGQHMMAGVPALINVQPLVGGDGRTFVVDDVNAWGWTPFGVLAIGRYDDEDEDAERTMLFQGDSVKSIEFRVERYKELIEESQDDDQADEPSEVDGAAG